MPAGNPIPEDVRGSLPPQALQLIEQYDSEFGVGNDISFQVAQSYLETPAPVVQAPKSEGFRRQPITEGEIGAVEAEVRNAEFTDIWVNEPNLTFEEATAKANRRVTEESESRRKSTTIEGHQVSATTEQDIREASSDIAAFRMSLGPQVVTVGRQQRKDELGLPQEEINRLRKQVIISSKVEARRLAKEEGLDYDFDSVKFNRYVDRVSGRLMADSLRDLHSDWFRSAKKSILKENGLEDAEDFPDTPEGKEMLSEAQGLADDTYNMFVPIIFEDLGDVEVDGVSLVPSGKSGAIRRAAERIQKGEASLATKVGMGFYSNWHDYDPGSGEVAETWLSAGIRDVGLIPRAVTYPLMRASTWDMDPATGKPYDENDPMYRLAKWQEDQLADGNLVEKGGAWLSGMFFGHGYNLDKNMNTGSVLRDFAISHARGEMLSSDFERLQATRTAQNAGVLPHWWDEAWGIGLEVVAPLEVAKLPFMAGRKLTEAGARAGRGIAEAAHFDTAADVMEAVRAAANTTDSLTDALILRRFRRQAYEDLGLPVPPKSPLKGAVAAPERFADDMAADLSKKLITADDWDGVKKMFAGMDDTHPLMTPLGTAWDGLRELRSLSKLKGQKYINKLDDLEKTKAGRRLLAEVRAAGGLKSLRQDIPDKVMAFNVVQGLMKNDVSKLIANHIPNNFVFATDSLIVRKGAWLNSQKAILKKLKQTTAGKHIKTKDGVFFKFDKPEEAAAAMRRAFDETDLSNAHRDLIKEIDRTGLVPQDKYVAMHSLAKESIVLDELPVGAFSVKDPMDLASARAASLSNKRAFTKARWVEDIAKGTRAFFRGDSDYRFVVAGGGLKRSRLTGRDLFRPTGGKFLDDTPEAFKKWHKETMNKLNNASRVAEDLFMKANKGNAEEISLSMAVKKGSADLKKIDTGIPGIDEVSLQDKLEDLGSGQAVAKWLSGATNNESYKEILKRIHPFVGGVDVRIMKEGVSGPIAVAKGSARGMAVMSKGEDAKAVVWFRGVNMGSSGLDAETIIHELIHAATMRRMKDAKLYANADSSLQRAWIGVNDITKRVIKERRRLVNSGVLPKDIAGPNFINPDEVVAWGLTNKEFQDFLKTIKISPEETLYTRFVSTIRRLLKIPDGETNALSEIIRLTDNILSSDLSKLEKRDWTAGFALSAVKTTGRSSEEAVEIVLNNARAGAPSIEAYETLVNIFFSPAGQSLSDFLGRSGDLQDILRAANLPSTLTVDGIEQAIKAVRDVVTAKKGTALDATALKQQVFAGIGITGKDNIGALMAAYVTKSITDDIFARATKELIEDYPNLVFKVPDKADASVRAEMFRDTAITQGLDPEIVDLVMPNIKSALGANNAHRQSIANAIVMQIYKEGNLATGADLDRIYNASNKSVAGIVGKDSDIPAAYGKSIEDIRKKLKAIAPDDVEEMMRLVVPSYIKAVADIDMNSVRAQFAATGVSGRRGAVGVKKPVGLTSMDFGHGTMMYDDRLVKLADQLAKPMKQSAILGQMDKLRPGQRKAFDWLLEVLSTTRKTTITGILGGFPLPGTRFLGTNALTNPFITAITAPEYALVTALKTPSSVAGSFSRAFRRAGFLPGDRAYDPLKMMYTGDETVVMFTAADGKVWTKGMFQEATAKHNIRFSQASFEFGFDSFQDVMRASKVGPDGRPLRLRARVDGIKGPPSVREYWEFLRPDKRNVWTMMAEEMDNLQREAVFASALKSGMRVDEASALGRASLLDYGATPEWVRQKFAKHMAFVGFRYNMMVETMSAFARDGRALNNMARQMNFINVQRKDMEEWVLDPDWVKTRFWKTDGEKFREWHASSLGPGIPFADSFAGLINIGSMIMDRKLGNSIGMGGATVKITDELFGDPRIQQVLDIAALKGDSNAPDGYMPTEYIAAFEYFGAGDMLLSLFNCEIVAPDRRRPDIGTHNGNQYQFRDEDSSRMFKLFQLGLLTTGVNRNLRDYPRALAGVGVSPGSIEFAKGAEGGATFWFGGSVAARRDADAAVDYINNNYVRHMKSGLRRQSYK